MRAGASKGAWPWSSQLSLVRAISREGMPPPEPSATDTLSTLGGGLWTDLGHTAASSTTSSSLNLMFYWPSWPTGDFISPSEFQPAWFLFGRLWFLGSDPPSPRDGDERLYVFEKTSYLFADGCPPCLQHAGLAFTSSASGPPSAPGVRGSQQGEDFWKVCPLWRRRALDYREKDCETLVMITSPIDKTVLLLTIVYKEKRWPIFSLLYIFNILQERRFFVFKHRVVTGDFVYKCSMFLLLLVF